MKHISILFYSLCLFSQSLLAQYIPFVEEGKTWIVRSPNIDDEDERSTYYFYQIKGDTIVNGINWFKFYITEIHPFYQSITKGCDYSEYQLIREEDRVVYFRSPLDSIRRGYTLYHSSDTGVLFIDFNADIGDTLHIMTNKVVVSIPQIYPAIVKGKGEIEVLGHKFQSTEIEWYYPNIDSPRTIVPLTWVEGLGCFPEPFWNDNQMAWGGWGNRPVDLIFCAVGADTLCIDYLRYEGMKRVLSGMTELNINLPSREENAPKSEPSALTFDLQGRRLQDVPRRGVFIQAGKKLIK